MSETENIEQLWYTWSTTGLDAMPAGIRVRAASPGLTDLNSQRMRALDRYLRYMLPTGTNRLEVEPQQAPVCLAFVRGENGERVLVHKVYTGRDGRNRPGNYFAHMLAGLPPTFSARDAIALWRSVSWQTIDVPAQGQNGQGKYLQKISLHDLAADANPWSRVDKEKMHQYLPQFIQFYLLQRDSVHKAPHRQDLQREIADLQVQIQKHAKDRQKHTFTDLQRELGEKEQLLQGLPQQVFPRIYLAASADEAAYLVSCLCDVLPTQWLEELTFSTYEQDVQVKHECVIVNTCIPPTPQEASARTPDVLPAACYEGLALNCYVAPVSSHDDISIENSLAARYANYATNMLVAQSIERLNNFLLEVSQEPDLTVDDFLHRFYLIEKKTYTREEIIWHCGYFIPVSKEDGFRNAVCREVIQDLSWFQDILKPLIVDLYKQSGQKPMLARALKDFGLSTRKTFITHFRNREQGAVSALLMLLESLQPVVPDNVDFWIDLLTVLTTDVYCKNFIQDNWDLRVDLLRIAIQVLSCEKDEHLPIIDALLSCAEVQSELDFQRLLLLELPPEWMCRAAKLFLPDEKTLRLQPAMVHIFEHSKEKIASLTAHLLSIPQQDSDYRQVALIFFKKLTRGGYPYLDQLQYIWWNNEATRNELNELLDTNPPGLVTSEELLQRYGAHYIQKDDTAPIIFQLFQQVAKTSNKKIPILFSLLDQTVGVNVLVQLLNGAKLSSGEIVNFLARYGADNKKRYPQQAYPPYPVLYPAAACWGNMLVSLAGSRQQDTLKWSLLTCCLDAFKKNYTAQSDISIELLLRNAQLNTSEVANFFKEYGKSFVPFCYQSSFARSLYLSFVKSSIAYVKSKVLWSWFANPEKLKRADMEWLLLNSALTVDEKADFLEAYGTTYIPAYPDSQVVSDCIEGYLDSFDLVVYRSGDYKKRTLLEFLAHQPLLSQPLQSHAQIINEIVILAQQQASLSQKDITELAASLYQIPEKREQLLSPVAQVLALRVQDAVQLGNVIATMQVVFHDNTSYTGKMLYHMIKYLQEEIENNVHDDIYAQATRIAAYLQFLLGENASVIMAEEDRRRKALDILLQQRRVQIFQAINEVTDTWLPRRREKWYRELQFRGMGVAAANRPLVNQNGEMEHLQQLSPLEQIEPTKELQPSSTLSAQQAQPSFWQRLRTIATIPLEVPLVLSVVWWQLPQACKMEGTGQLTVIWSLYSSLLKRYKYLVPEKQWEKLRFAVAFHRLCLLADEATPEASGKAEAEILQLVDDDENQRLYIPFLVWHEHARIGLARKRLREIQMQEENQVGNPVQHSPIVPAMRLPSVPHASYIPGSGRPPQSY